MTNFAGSGLKLATHQESRGNSETWAAAIVTGGSDPRCHSVSVGAPNHAPCSSSPSRRSQACQCRLPSYLRKTTRTLPSLLSSPPLIVVSVTGCRLPVIHDSLGCYC